MTSRTHEYFLSRRRPFDPDKNKNKTNKNKKQTTTTKSETRTTASVLKQDVNLLCVWIFHPNAKLDIESEGKRTREREKNVTPFLFVQAYG